MSPHVRNMPRTYTKQQLEEQYRKLPEALKEAMFNSETSEKIYEIGKKNALNIEKMGFIAEEVGFLILGLTRPSEFVGVLTERLGVDRDAAQKIASEINHQIFFPLREALKQTHQVDVNEEAIQQGEIVPQRSSPTAAPPQPPPTLPIPPAAAAPRRPETARPVSLLPLPSRPEGFLTKEEVENLVAEKKAAAPTPKPPAAPEFLAPKPPPSPPATPMISRPIPPPIPPASSQSSSKIPPIDLRTAPPPHPAPPAASSTYRGYDPYREPIE